MGEIAEMMLDGTMCSACGEFLECNFDMDGGADGIIEDTSPGFPMMCAACQYEAERSDVPVAPTPKKRRAHKRSRVAKANVNE